jgi:hypothetical protein
VVCNCHQSLTKLAEHNRVQLIWVLGHRKLNKMKLPTNWQELDLVNHEWSLDWHVVSGEFKWAIWEWMNRDHQGYWMFIPGQKHAKEIAWKSSSKTKEVFNINRNQLGYLTTILTCHCSQFLQANVRAVSQLRP